MWLCGRWRRVGRLLAAIALPFFFFYCLRRWPATTDGGYVERLDRIRAGELTSPQEVENPGGFVTIGMILVNLNKTEKLPNKLKSDVERTFDGIFAHSQGTALHLVIITEAAGVARVAGALANILGQDLATRVIRPRSWQWRPSKGLPPIHVRVGWGT